MNTNLRLKIRDIFKKNKRLILTILIVWAAVFVINYILGHLPEKDNQVPTTTYTPHTAVMDESEVPKKIQDPIENLIKDFMEACNSKDYDKAYNILSADCRSEVFEDIETFKQYIDGVFDEKKIYNIQNFSNKNGYYIYTVTILDDIMASGMTGEEQLETTEETFVIKEENGSLKLAIKGYLENKTVDKMYEDNNLKINIEDVKIDYETMTYTIKVRNKVDDIIVLDDFSEKNEIVLSTDMGDRNASTGLMVEPIVIYPNETKYFDLKFTRFYDEYGNVNSMKFNRIRVLKTYTGLDETKESELQNATAIYSIELNL